MKECDKAIQIAITFGGGKKESPEINAQFEVAIRHLKKCGNPHIVNQLMEAAEANDKKMMTKWRKQSEDRTKQVVEFHILQSLPHENPVIVKQALRRGANTEDLPEILWNFGHLEDKNRLTLAQNPHFYRNLSNSPDAYGGALNERCIEDGSLPNKIFVPTNSSHRVYFDFSGNRRVFDVWKTERALLFKNVRGHLVGETNIEDCIMACAAPFHYCKRHTPGRPQAEEVGTTRDWRDLIRAAKDTTRHICVIAPVI